MRNLKRNMGRYLGIGLAALLVLAAIYLPQVWFALRDAASLGRIQGESLAPLMVAQLDRSYERDIYKRMRAYMEAYTQEDVNCSSKEIDPENESLWENIEQTDNCILMNALLGWQYVTNAPMKGLEPVIVSCNQYVLMRRSDGQILLVANDILLDKGDGCHMELLIDGVDGTVYYLESEENNYYPLLPKWFDDAYAWEWRQVLNETYYTEEKKREDESFASGAEIYVSTDRESSVYVESNRSYSGYANPWVTKAGITDIYCCLLTYGEEQFSWSMEIEKPQGEDFYYRIRAGLPGVVSPIPEMNERISLAEYDRVHDMADGGPEEEPAR